MAKPPELIRDTDDAWKLAGSFHSGRYQFGVTPAGEGLLRDELGYDEGDTVPWNCFRTLVYTGDAWLPSATDRPVETGDDLARPEEGIEMPDADARALAELVKTKRLDERQRDALASHVAETKLKPLLSIEGLSGSESSSDGNRNEATPSDSPSSKRRTPTTVLHVSDSYLKPGGTEDADGVHGLAGFDAAIDVALGEGVDAVVHTGNLFASATPPDAVEAACADRLNRLARHDVPFFVVAGRNEATDTVALDALAETTHARRLGTTPVNVGGVVLYGIDHRPDMATADETISLADPEEHCLKLCCVHQAISPPYSEYGADVEAYELTVERVDGWIDVLLCGGTDRAVEWEGDELGVYYAGTTDETRVREDEAEPLVNLFTARGEEVERETISLEGYDADGRNGEPRKEPNDGGRTRSSDDGRPASATTDAAEDVRLILTATGTLAATLDGTEISDFDRYSTAELADMYALFSAVRGQLETMRTDVRDVLSSPVGEGEEVAGSFGSVGGYRRTRKSLRDDETVLSTLERHGVRREAVVMERIDETKVEEIIEEEGLDIDESTLYDITENSYVRRNDIDHDALRRSFEE